MSIADTLNPFVAVHEEIGVTEEGHPGYLQAPKTTILSAHDMIVIAQKGSTFRSTPVEGVTSVQAEVIYVDPNSDLEVFALGVTLLSDLVMPGRTVRICCDRFSVLRGDASARAVTIDVSAPQLEKYAQPLTPTKVWSSPSGGSAADGAVILKALKENNYADYFGDPPAGSDWGAAGAAGGSVTLIARELQFVGSASLSLFANGANGNAGISGQSRNWMPGASGGAALEGGVGGSGGSLRVGYGASFWLPEGGQPAQPLPAGDRLEAAAEPGKAGVSGAPGDAFDAARASHHYGSEARPVGAGEGGSVDVEVLPHFEIPLRDPITNKVVPDLIADMSEAASLAPLYFWSLLYHRLKLAYMQYQPQPHSIPGGAGWEYLGRLVRSGQVFSYAYTEALPAECVPLVAVRQDPDFAGKKSMAAAMLLLKHWHALGRTMWGYEPEFVPNMPWARKLAMLHAGFAAEKDARDMYIALRRERDEAIARQDNLARMRAAAQQDVQKHLLSFRALREAVAGDGSSNALLEQLIAASEDCNASCKKLQTAIKGFKSHGETLFNFNLDTILESLQSLAFTVSDPAGAALTGGLGIFKTLDSGFNKIRTDEGLDVSKSVLRKVDQFSDDLQEVANMAVAIGGDADRKSTEVIMGTMDQVEKFVNQFTQKLGDDAKAVDKEIANYRACIQRKNDIWFRLSTMAAQMAREYEDYEQALQRQQELDATPEALKTSMLNTVMRYTQVYLANVEKTADAIAWLRRKFNYVTLGADAGPDYVGQSQAFWQADASLEATDAVLEADFGKVVGMGDKLDEYESSQSSLVLQAPPDDKERSPYFVLLDGAVPAQRLIIERLLSDHELVIKVDLPSGARGQGVVSAAGTRVDTVVVRDANMIYDARVLGVVPWLEGAQTATKTLHFQIRNDTQSANLDQSKQTRVYKHPFSVLTDFRHYTCAVADAPGTQARAGTEMGPLANNYVDSRGLFSVFVITLPGVNDPNSSNFQLTADPAKARLCIDFRVSYRNRSAARAAH